MTKSMIDIQMHILDFRVTVVTHRKVTNTESASIVNFPLDFFHKAEQKTSSLRMQHVYLELRIYLLSEFGITYAYI